MTRAGKDEAPTVASGQGFQDGTRKEKFDSQAEPLAGQALRVIEGGPHTPVPKLQSDWHRLGAGLSVRFHLDPGRLDAEWRPRPPTRRELHRVLDRYREARGKFLAEISQRIGGEVLCVEVPL
jgi:hypothetical protein